MNNIFKIKTKLTILLSILFMALLSLDYIKANDKTDNDKVSFNEAKLFNLVADRQNQYQTLNPNLSNEDVKWHIKNNLDIPFFKKIVTIDKKHTSPLLVNKYYKLDDSFKPQNLVKFYSKHFATKDTVYNYKKMLKNAKSDKISFKVASAYRSIKDQENLYNNYLKKSTREKVDRFSARPGSSEHHTGRALDLFVDGKKMENFGDSDASEWINKNAHKYGFIVRYKKGVENITGYIGEPWHITYVGNEISNKMFDEKIDTLEEYVAKYQSSILI